MAEAILEPPPVLAEPLPPRPWLAVASLCKRELVRFVRQRNRLVGAIGQPLIFWVLFGAGLGPSFKPPEGTDLSYSAYFLPGILALIVLFTAIFATISIIEDRREGFLQSVLVAPIPRWAMTFGKVLGGSLIALLQAALFLLLGAATGLGFSPLAMLAALAWLLLVAIALTSLGFMLAWRLDSVQGFHAIMSVLLMPMWLLSGAFFPAGDNWLGWVIRLNPLTYGVAGLRRVLYWDWPQPPLPSNLPSAGLCFVVTVLFAAVTLTLACRMSRGHTTGDLL